MEYITTTLGNLVHQTAFFSLTWGNVVILLITAMDFYQIRKNSKNCIYQKYEYISRLMMQSVSVTGKNCLPRSSGNILQIPPSCS